MFFLWWPSVWFWMVVRAFQVADAMYRVPTAWSSLGAKVVFICDNSKCLQFYVIKLETYVIRLEAMVGLESVG